MISDYLTVSVALSDTPFESSPTWADQTDKVRELTITTGRRSLDDTFAVGTCTLEVNNESSGQWLDPDTWYRFRQIKIETSTTTLFEGWITKVEHNVNPVNAADARLECVDACGLMADAGTDIDLAAWFAGGGFGEWYAKTIDGEAGYVTDGAAFEIAGWLLSDNTPALGNVIGGSRMPVFVAATQTGRGFQLLQDYLEAERGQIVPDGRDVEMLGRYSRFIVAAGSSIGTFADDGTGYKYLRGSLVLAAPDETYIDEAIVGGKGIDPARTADIPTDYPPSAYVRDTQSPIADQNWAQANADLIVAVGKQTNTYPRQLECQIVGPAAASYDTAHPGAVAVAGRSRVSVKYGGSTYDCAVESVEHSLSIKDGWRTTLGFSSIDRLTAAYTSTSIFKLGTSALGGTDILGP